MPLAFAALEKLNELNMPGLDRNTPMLTDSSYSGQINVHTDSLSANGLPSIAQYIREIFLISDNDAYNRLYEFVGQQTLNEKLWQRGYAKPDYPPVYADDEEEKQAYQPHRYVKMLVDYDQTPDITAIFSSIIAKSTWWAMLIIKKTVLYFHQWISTHNIIN